MSCTCRATPLKIFVQGLSQVHKVDTSTSLLRLPTRTPARSALYQNSFAFARQARSLHFSKTLNQDASGAASKDTGPAVDATARDERPSVKDEHSFATDETPESIPWKSQPGTDNQTSKPRKRREKSETSSEPRYGRNVRIRGESDSAGDRNGFQDTPNRRPKGPSPLQGQSKESYWKVQKAALKEKFPEGWRPRKRLSPDALTGIRALNAQFPDVYTTEALAMKFEVSPEAIRRILRSKWQANPDEEEKRTARWFRRGKDVWEQKAALGIKPPQKWRREGITRDPTYHAWKKEAVQRNREREERDDREIRGTYPPRSGRGRS